MRYLLLTSAFMLLSYNYAAASSNDFGVNLGTHTHLPQIELNSPSLLSQASFKVASVCGLGSGSCAEKFGFNSSDSSTNTNKCSAGYIFVANQGCMLDKCPNGYSQDSCSGSTPIQSATAPAPSGRICYQCRAENCSNYSLTTCPANGNCSSCPDNSSKKKLDSCSTNYKVSGNTCTQKICPADFGCSGSQACISGTCKDDSCPVGYQKSNTCTNGIEDAKNNAAGNSCYKCKICPYTCTLSTCPDANAECSFESCSGKFCLLGCKTGFTDENAYWNNL